jgi:2,3-bisphosphoglycerate-independent phosphoglycerate mutase
MNPVPTVALIILDGWGIREKELANAVVQADTPNYSRWLRQYERAIVDASGEAVGLTPGQMGNSEVGHLNLGAGHIVYQDITRVDVAIRDGSFFQNAALNAAIDGSVARNRPIQLVGLLGSGGVHSHSRQLYAFLRLINQRGGQAMIHAITDGRDTPPRSSPGYLAELEGVIAAEGLSAEIASVSGRYWSMDRDMRQERTRAGYDAIMFACERHAPTPAAAIAAAHAEGTTDEFILPTVISHPDPDSRRLADGDTLIFWNFRADRMRQIVPPFAFAGFDGFERSYQANDLSIFTLTGYEKNLPVTVLFPKKDVVNPLARVISEAGHSQFHSAETEKYPHVTYFFNGGRELPFPGEERQVVPSPKVATYDLQPEMSAAGVADGVLQRLATHDDAFVLVNFANPDMVGHTGSLPAAIRAVETVDYQAGRIVEGVLAKGGVAIVTADHGNCEVMQDLVTGEPHTYHTINPVSLFVIGQGYYALEPRGILADVAPTVLHLLGIPKPAEMTGQSLVMGNG